MTIDERIERLTASQEKTQAILAGMLESIERLERIAAPHKNADADVEAALAALEGKTRRPQ